MVGDGDTTKVTAQIHLQGRPSAGKTHELHGMSMGKR